MVSIEALIEVLLDDRKNLVWLPVLTLGYIFTISSELLHFGMGVAAIGGATVFYDMATEVLGDGSTRDTEYDGWEDILGVIPHSRFIRQLLLLVMGLYALSIVISIRAIFNNFDPENLILTGITYIWIAVPITAIIHGDTLLRESDPDETVEIQNFLG